MSTTCSTLMAYRRLILHSYGDHLPIYITINNNNYSEKKNCRIRSLPPDKYLITPQFPTSHHRVVVSSSIAAHYSFIAHATGSIRRQLGEKYSTIAISIVKKIITPSSLGAGPRRQRNRPKMMAHSGRLSSNSGSAANVSVTP